MNTIAHAARPTVPEPHNDLPAGTAPRTVSKGELNKVVLASVVGSFVEWFEFSVYGYLAATLGKVFFSSSSESVQLIASLAAFAIAFLSRPFGGLLFGPLGDKFGRKRVLTATIILMAGATFGIGLIPSYATIGIAAPILLVCMRLLQGLSAGGEASGAAIFVAEYSPDKSRTAVTSWIEVGCISGFFFGAAIATTLTFFFTTEQITEWAWRLPFWLALPLGSIGLYIRNHLEETPAFEAMRASKAKPKVDWAYLFSTHRGALLQSSGMIIVTNVTLFTVITYIPTYLVSTVHMTTSNGLLLSLGPQFFLICMIPILGIVADRIGRKTMMLIGSVAVAVFAVPCFHILMTGGIAAKVASLLVLNLCLAALLSCILCAVPALFNIKVRFTGMALSYNVSVAMFAGTAPLLNAWLIGKTGDPLVPAYYLIFGAVVGIVALLYSPEMARKPMRGDAPSA